MGITTVEEYSEFKKSTDYEMMTDLGFTTKAEVKEYKRMRFDSKAEFEHCKELGFKTKIEYDKCFGRKVTEASLDRLFERDATLGDFAKLAGVVTADEALAELTHHCCDVCCEARGLPPRGPAVGILETLRTRQQYKSKMELIRILRRDTYKLVTPAYIKMRSRTRRRLPCRQNVPESAFVDLKSYRPGRVSAFRGGRKWDIDYDAKEMKKEGVKEFGVDESYIRLKPKARLKEGGLNNFV